MPEKPEDHFAVGEPRTLETRRLGGRQAEESPSAAPRLRLVIFWALVGGIVVIGVVLYFMSAESIAPVLRTGS